MTTPASFEAEAGISLTASGRIRATNLFYAFGMGEQFTRVVLAYAGTLV
jgi:hypothetical protein